MDWSMNKIQLEVLLNSEKITVVNSKGLSKSFPRCGITHVEMFVKEMVKDGNLDDLLFD